MSNIKLMIEENTKASELLLNNLLNRLSSVKMDKKAKESFESLIGEKMGMDIYKSEILDKNFNEAIAKAN